MGQSAAVSTAEQLRAEVSTRVDPLAADSMQVRVVAFTPAGALAVAMAGEGDNTGSSPGSSVVWFLTTVLALNESGRGLPFFPSMARAFLTHHA